MISNVILGQKNSRREQKQKPQFFDSKLDLTPGDKANTEPAAT